MSGSSRAIDAALIASSVVLQSASGVFGKLAARSADAAVASLYLNPWWALSIVALALQALVWMAALRRLPISVAYPFMSLSYVLGVFAGWALFGEVVAAPQVMGILVIAAGVVIANRSAA